MRDGQILTKDPVLFYRAPLAPLRGICIDTISAGADKNPAGVGAFTFSIEKATRSPVLFGRGSDEGVQLNGDDDRLLTLESQSLRLG